MFYHAATVHAVRRELGWMAAENRQAQKYECGVQLLATGWPNGLAPAQREYIICWILSQTPKVTDFLKSRGFLTDQNAHELKRYLNALKHEPTTVLQREGFYSTMTLLTFKAFEIRSAVLKKFGGSSGIPLYQDEDHPLHGKHIKVAPSSPQWQRKLQAPLRVVLICINSHPDHNSSSRLTILWKTLTILSPVQDADFHEGITAWARLHHYQSAGEFRGRLEVVQELRVILEGRPVDRHAVARAEETGSRGVPSSGLTGKGAQLGKGKRHWSHVAIYTHDYEP